MISGARTPTDPATTTTVSGATTRKKFVLLVTMRPCVPSGRGQSVASLVAKKQGGPRGGGPAKAKDPGRGKQKGHGGR